MVKSGPDFRSWYYSSLVLKHGKLIHSNSLRYGYLHPFQKYVVRTCLASASDSVVCEAHMSDVGLAAQRQFQSALGPAPSDVSGRDS